MKNWHIIKEYDFATNKITCVCDWNGSGGNADKDSAWFKHRRDNRNDPAPVGFNKKNFVYAPGNKLS